MSNIFPINVKKYSNLIDTVTINKQAKYNSKSPKVCYIVGNASVSLRFTGLYTFQYVQCHLYVQII